MKDGILLTKQNCEGDSDKNDQQRPRRARYLPSAAIAFGKSMLSWRIFRFIPSRTSNSWPQDDVLSRTYVYYLATGRFQRLAINLAINGRGAIFDA